MPSVNSNNEEIALNTYKDQQDIFTKMDIKNLSVLSGLPITEVVRITDNIPTMDKKHRTKRQTLKELSQIGNCLMKEYCYELAEKYRTIYTVIASNKNGLSNIRESFNDGSDVTEDDNAEMMRYIDSDIDTINRVTNNGTRLEGNLTGILNCFSVENSQTTILSIRSRCESATSEAFVKGLMNNNGSIKDLIKNELTHIYKEAKSDTEYAMRLLKDLNSVKEVLLLTKETKSETTNDDTLVNSKESAASSSMEWIEDACRKNIVKIFNSTPVNTTVPNRYTRIKLEKIVNGIKSMLNGEGQEETGCFSSINHIVGLNNVVERSEIEATKDTGSNAAKRILRATCKGIGTDSNTRVFFTDDNMAIKASYDLGTMYLYYTLYDILTDNIDWEDIEPKYRITKQEVLELEIQEGAYSEEAFVNRIMKLLFLLPATASIFEYKKVTDNNKHRKFSTKASLFEPDDPTVTRKDDYKTICDMYFDGKSKILQRKFYDLQLYVEANEIATTLSGTINSDYSIMVKKYDANDKQDSLIGTTVQTFSVEDNSDPKFKGTFRSNTVMIETDKEKADELNADATTGNRKALHVKDVTNLESEINRRALEKMYCTYYNLIPHALVYYGEETNELCYIPVGDISDYKSNILNNSRPITMAEFMYNPGMSESVESVEIRRKTRVADVKSDSLDNLIENVDLGLLPTYYMVYFGETHDIDEANPEQVVCDTHNIEVREGSPVDKLMKYSFTTKGNLDRNAGATRSMTISASEDVYSKAYLLILDEKNMQTSNYRIDIEDDYEAYTDDELAEIIGDLTSSQTLARDSGSVLREEFKLLEGSGGERKTIYTDDKSEAKRS